MVAEDAGWRFRREQGFRREAVIRIRMSACKTRHTERLGIYGEEVISTRTFSNFLAVFGETTALKRENFRYAQK